MVETPDQHWVDQARNGNEEGFAMLVNRYQNIVYHMAYRMTGDSAASEDITQNTFLKAYNHLDTYNPDHRFFSWLYRIGVNEAINYIKRNRPGIPLDSRIRSSEKNPEERVLQDETRIQVQNAVLSLPPRYRILIVMRHYQNLSYQEMARALQVPEKKIKARLYRARQALRMQFIKEGLFSHE